MSMKILDELATEEEIIDFLLYHMDKADERKSRINPSLTKQEVWDIYMGMFMRGKEVSERAKASATKNITKEFGEYYEDGKE